MAATLDALLTALYVLLEDMLVPPAPGGTPPALSDAELICMAVAQVMLGYPKDRHWLRNAAKHVGHLFPVIPTQSRYNRRLRRLAPQILEAIRLVAFISDAWHDSVKIIDSTPIPVAMSRETVKRSDFAGYASYGYCASHSRYFYGFRLHLICAPCGMPIGFELAAANVDDRVILAELASEGILKPGDTVLADKNYSKHELETDLAEIAVQLIRPDRSDEPKRFGKLGGMRQWIESIIQSLKGQLSLEDHGARTMDALISRIGRRLLALATAVWQNLQLGTPPRNLVPYDH